MIRRGLMEACSRRDHRLGSPFSITRDGECYDVASDGMTMIVVNGATWPAPSCAPKPPGVSGILETPHTHRATVDGIIDWAVGPRDVCQHCDGGGVDYSLGDERRCWCGEGTPATVGALLPGGTVRIDARLLLRALLIASAYGDFRTSTVRWGGERDPVFIQGDVAMVVIMPMVHGEAHWLMDEWDGLGPVDEVQGS